MASSAPPQPPPRITIYRNGDKHFTGKKFVVNRKYYRSFENFLDRVTADTNSRVAIRKIHTPMGGTKVGSLEMIQNGAVYVAAGTERFRRVNYGTSPLKTVASPSNSIQPVTHSKINAISRHKQEAMAEPLRNRIIFVYRNGEDKTPPVKLLLDKRTLRSMDAVLQYISNKVSMTSGSVRSIHALETGVKITEISEIHTNNSYVAVGAGKHFHKGQIFSEGWGKAVSQSPRAKFEQSFKSLNKSKLSKKLDEEHALTSSLSLPDPGLTSGLIALSEEIKESVNDTGLNVSGKNFLQPIKDGVDEIVTSVSEEEDNAVDIISPDERNHLDSPVVDNHEETVVIPEGSAVISGTPPIQLDSPLVEHEETQVVQEASHLSGTPPVGISYDIEATTGPVEPDNDENDEEIGRPPFTSSPMVAGNGEPAVDDVIAKLADTTLNVDSSGDNVDNAIADDTVTLESSGRNDGSTDEISSLEKDQLDHDNIPLDEEPAMDKISYEEETPGVYKASGLQKESGDLINDDRETTVEQTIDMMVADEVEEDLEDTSEPQEGSKFYS